jgi:hypothetical protein
MVHSVVRLRASAPCSTAEPGPRHAFEVGAVVASGGSARNVSRAEVTVDANVGPVQHDDLVPDLDEVRCDLEQRPAWTAAGNVTTTILATPPPPVYRSPVQHGLVPSTPSSGQVRVHLANDRIS